MKAISRMGKFSTVFDSLYENNHTFRIIPLWLTIVITFSLSGLVTTAVAADNDFLYKEYWYRTEQLCPDLQESVAGKDIDTANLPYKSVFRFMDYLQSISDAYGDLPCILEANGPQRLVSTALIEAIHVDTRPWNFSTAQVCEEHIKLRLPEPTFLKRSNDPKIICKIPKTRAKNSSANEATGSLYHPYVWQFQKGKLGLSFSSFNLSHLNSPPPPPVVQITEANSTGQNSSQPANAAADDTGRNLYWLEPDPNGHQYVQIVFSTHFAGACTIRVQQYVIDAQKTLCEGIQQRTPFRLCGLYDCSEKPKILRTLGFWSTRKEQEKLDVLLRTEIPRWRKDPTYLEVLVSTLRALTMPLLFLSVFYVTRRLRLKLASRQQTSSRTLGLDRHRNVLRQRQCYLRSLMRDGRSTSQNANSASDINSEHSMLRPSLILNHVVYDMPVGGGYDDLPPPYESIVQPPSYLEATNTVKPSPSPVDQRSPSPGCGNHSESGNILPESSSQSDGTDEETVGLISASQGQPRPTLMTQQSRSLSISSNSHLST